MATNDDLERQLTPAELRQLLRSDLASRQSVVDAVCAALDRLEKLEDIGMAMASLFYAPAEPAVQILPAAAPADIPPAAPAGAVDDAPPHRPARYVDWTDDELRERVTAEIWRLSTNGVPPSEAVYNVRREGVPHSKVWRQRLECTYIDMVEAAGWGGLPRRRRRPNTEPAAPEQPARKRRTQKRLTIEDIEAQVANGAEPAGHDDPPTVLQGKIKRETEHVAMTAKGPVRVTSQYIELK